MTDQPGNTTTADLERLLSEITPGPWKMGRFESYEFDGTPFRRVYFGSGEAHITGADCDQNARAIAMLHDLLAEVIALRAEAERLSDVHVTVEAAAKVLLDALGRAQIDSSILRMFYNGEPKAALTALAKEAEQ